MRTRTFRLYVEVSRPFALVAHIQSDAAIAETFRRQSADLRGPRGGRYVAIGDLYDLGSTDDVGWARNTRAYRARIDGRLRSTQPSA